MSVHHIPKNKPVADPTSQPAAPDAAQKSGAKAAPAERRAKEEDRTEQHRRDQQPTVVPPGVGHKPPKDTIPASKFKADDPLRG